METATAPAETGHALVIERIFDARPDLVFRLWSDPARVKEWWHPEGFETTHFDMDFRVGGCYRFTASSPTSSHSAHGVYREIVVPERIVMSFEWEGASADAGRPTLITIDFAPHDEGRTRLSFRQAPFASPESRDNHVKGWSQVLDAFAATLAGARS